jgi:hypothetical protein
MISMARAIKAINPAAEFNYTNENYNSIEWLNNTTPISLEDIEAKKIEVAKQDVIDAELAETSRQSALNKLTALGLTESEIQALTKIINGN